MIAMVILALLLIIPLLGLVTFVQVLYLESLPPCATCRR